MLTLILLVLTLPNPQPAPVRTSAPLIFEKVGKEHFSRTSTYVQLDAGPGWLKVPKVFTEFELACEFRLTTDDTEAELLLSAPRNQEIRIRFPRAGELKPSALVKAHRTKLDALSPMAPVPGGEADWKRLKVRVDDGELSIVVDDITLGRYSISDFTGYVLFKTRKGGLQLRWIAPQTLADGAPAAGAPPLLRPGSVPGLTGPEIVKEVRPDYTGLARARKIQGVVEVEAVVLPDGRVGHIEVLRSLDGDLDRAAVVAVRQWRFRPATKDGVPVPILVNIELTFTVK